GAAGSTHNEEPRIAIEKEPTTNAKRRPSPTLLRRSARHCRLIKLIALARAPIQRPKRRSRSTPPDLRTRAVLRPIGKRQNEPVCVRPTLSRNSKSAGPGV